MSAETLQSLSPQVLNRVIGQRAAVEQAQIALDAAHQDGQAFPATLMTGPPGLGKSMIAQTIAHEMASGYSEVLGQALTLPCELNAMLLAAPEKSILFIDECDELPVNLQTTLYKAVEERRVYLDSIVARKAPQAVPLTQFTIILASNHEHSIVQPLRDRMKLLLRFEYYSENELVEVVRQRTRVLGWEVEEEVLPLLAQRGRGTPRSALRLLESCRRICRSIGGNTINREHVAKACMLEGIDAGGLDRHELSLLRMLAESERPLRINVIAARLGLPAKTVANVFEPYLLRLGLIERCVDGRAITDQGSEYLAKTK